MFYRCDIIHQIDINREHLVANISLRDLDAATLSRIRSNARRRKLSVNRLIIETLRGDARAVRALRSAHEIHLPLIVLAELLAGFAAGSRRQKNHEALATQS